MSEKNLRGFQIDLKHHLFREQEMFEAGLIIVPPSNQEVKLKEATEAIPVTIEVEQTPDFPLTVKKREPLADFDLKVTPKRTGTPVESDFSITVKPREVPDFPLDIKKRPPQP